MRLDKAIMQQTRRVDNASPGESRAALDRLEFLLTQRQRSDTRGWYAPHPRDFGPLVADNDY